MQSAKYLPELKVPVKNSFEIQTLPYLKSKSLRAKQCHNHNQWLDSYELAKALILPPIISRISSLCSATGSFILSWWRSSRFNLLLTSTSPRPSSPSAIVSLTDLFSLDRTQDWTVRDCYLTSLGIGFFLSFLIWFTWFGLAADYFLLLKDNMKIMCMSGLLNLWRAQGKVEGKEKSHTCFLLDIFSSRSAVNAHCVE